MRAARHEARDVGHVREEERADLTGDVRETFEVDDTGIRRGSADDHLGTMLERELPHLIEINPVRIGAHAVLNDVEELAGDGDVPAVREVPAVRQRQAQQRVAGLEQAVVDREIGP